MPSSQSALSQCLTPSWCHATEPPRPGCLMKKVHDVAWNETQAHEHNDGDMEPPKGKSHKLPIGTRGEEELEEVYDYRYKDQYGRMLIAYQIKEQELWLLVLAQILVGSPLSVVPLKIGKNNCKPGETYRKTPSIRKIKKSPLQADGVFWTLLRKAWQNQTQFSPQGAGY